MQGIETEGKKSTAAGAVVVDCGEMVVNLLAQKRYGVEAEIEG